MKVGWPAAIVGLFRPSTGILIGFQPKKIKVGRNKISCAKGLHQVKFFKVPGFQPVGSLHGQIGNLSYGRVTLL
jgi:hypothetical protein